VLLILTFLYVHNVIGSNCTSFQGVTRLYRTVHHFCIAVIVVLPAFLIPVVKMLYLVISTRENFNSSKIDQVINFDRLAVGVFYKI
jgi:uncharacterized paraquat-inducible protein A